MGRYIIDSVNNGLLPDVDRIWVLGWYNLDTHKSGTITSYGKMRRFLSQPDLTLVCHNIKRYDVPVFEKVLVCSTQ
jgi:hypothetical protein